MFIKLSILSLLALSFQSLATSYDRGRFRCSDFEKMERLYRMKPDSVDYQMGYAICLLYKGDNDFDALSRLHHLADHHGLVTAAHEIAKYIESGGKFTRELVPEKINEAIEAYHKVLFMINLDPHYPKGQSIYELFDQIELHSHYAVTFLYLEKFMNGAEGTHNERLLQSPSYKGDRDINIYSEYSPYTLDSLDKVIEQGRECQNLPLKDHFIPVHYKAYTESCRLYVELTQALKPLELKRLTILNKESCQDLNKTNCPEYYEVLDEILRLVKQNDKTQGEVFRPMHEYEKKSDAELKELGW